MHPWMTSARLHVAYETLQGLPFTTTVLPLHSSQSPAGLNELPDPEQTTLAGSRAPLPRTLSSRLSGKLLHMFQHSLSFGRGRSVDRWVE